MYLGERYSSLFPFVLGACPNTRRATRSTPRVHRGNLDGSSKLLAEDPRHADDDPSAGESLDSGHSCERPRGGAAEDRLEVEEQVAFLQGGHHRAIKRPRKAEPIIQ